MSSQSLTSSLRPSGQDNIPIRKWGGQRDSNLVEICSDVLRKIKYMEGVLADCCQWYGASPKVIASKFPGTLSMKVCLTAEKLLASAANVISKKPAPGNPGVRRQMACSLRAMTRSFSKWYPILSCRALLPRPSPSSL